MSKRDARLEETVPDREALALLTARIVAAYVRGNRVSPDGVSPAIASVREALSGLGPRLFVPWAPDAPVKKPAVPKGSSVTDGYVACLECGRRMATLKRHIMTAHGKTPEQYRADWFLKADHPLIAPAYRAARSQIAKDLKLGVKKPERSNAPTRPAHRAAHKLGNKRARLARKDVIPD